MPASDITQTLNSPGMQWTCIGIGVVLVVTLLREIPRIPGRLLVLMAAAFLDMAQHADAAHIAAEVAHFIQLMSVAGVQVGKSSAPPSGVWRTTLKIARHYPRHFLQTNLSLSLWPLVNAPELAQAHFFSANISPADLQTYFQQLHSESYRAFVDMLLLNLPRPKRVKAPMLVLGAANDTIFTPQEVKATATAYHTEATIFPNMAHDMMLESGWQQVADAICTWMQGLGFAARKMS